MNFIFDNFNMNFLFAVFLILIFASAMNYSFAEGFQKCLFGKQVIFNYTITNNNLANICMDLDVQSIILTVNPDSDGILTVDVPKKVISSFSSCDENVWFVLANGEEIYYNELKNTEKIKRLYISFPNNTEEIEIIGSYVSQMPEPYTDCDHLYEDHRINIPPLQQTKLGISSQNIICEKNLFLIIKHDQTPACVKPQTAEKLIERGWIQGTIYSALSPEEQKQLDLQRVLDSCNSIGIQPSIGYRYSNDTHVITNSSCKWKEIENEN